MPSGDHKQLYQRWLEMWNGNLALATDIIAPGCVVHQLPGDLARPEGFRGPEGVRQMVEMGRAPFTGLTFETEVGPIVEGNMLAARWRSTGRYQAGIPGSTVPPDTPITFGGIDMMRIEAGKIAEYWVSSDGLHLMAQLGVLSA